MKKLYTLLLAPLFMVLFFSCDKDDWENSPAIEKEFNITAFTKIQAGDVFNIIITKGENFSIKAKGPENDVNDIQMSVDNNILRIKFANRVNGRPRIDVFISMPVFTTVMLSGAAEGRATGFDGQTMILRINLSGASKFTLNGAVNSNQLEISGGSELTITGVAAELYGTVTGGAKVAGYGLTTTYADIFASGGSTVRVNVTHILYADASGGSHIYYKGNPAEKHIEQSGGGQVVQE